jgi:isoleucyl-tRNA synthetase
LPELPAPADFLAELFISSTVHQGDTLKISETHNHKCGRCWRYLPEVEKDGALCERCEEFVDA